MARGVHIKDHWSEQRLFDQRAIVAGAIIIVFTLGLLGRLFLLQVIRHDYYAELSQGNRVRTEPIPAARGLILDRHGEVVAGNQPAYQLELVPEEVPNLQAALDGLVQLDLIRADDVDELKKTIRSRPGSGAPASVSSGISRAAAIVTAPRMPLQPTNARCCHGGVGSRSRMCGNSQRGTQAAGKIQIRRRAITVSAITAAWPISDQPPWPDSPSSTGRSWSPISPNRRTLSRKVTTSQNPLPHSRVLTFVNSGVYQPM